MSTHTHVPADVEPESLVDLLADCAAMPHVAFPALTALVPPMRSPESAAQAIVIPPDTVTLLDGYADHYGG